MTRLLPSASAPSTASLAPYFRASDKFLNTVLLGELRRWCEPCKGLQICSTASCDNAAMSTALWKQDASKEFSTPERCHIIETYNSAADESISVARARVQPGVTTAWHQVVGTVERYIIAEGRGRVEVGAFPDCEVGPGDVVIIPAGVRQRITNIGERDLIFYCVCTPRFRQENYRTLE